MKPPFDIPPFLIPVLRNAERMMEEGGAVHFKFTCGKCGTRQAFEQANSFFSKGQCEECGHTTDLLQPSARVNFLVIFTRLLQPTKES